MEPKINRYYFSPSARGINQKMKQCLIVLAALFFSACSGSSSDPDTTPVFPVPAVDMLDSTSLIVRAQEDVYARLGTAITLSATVLEEGLDVATPTLQWELLTGPVSANIVSPYTAVTPVVIDVAGQYVFRVVVTNGVHNSADTIVVTTTTLQTENQQTNDLEFEFPFPEELELQKPVVEELVIDDLLLDDSLLTESIVNEAPVVNAGRNEELFLDEVLELTGEVSDDGNPSNSLDIYWRKESGPGTATFGEITAPETTVTFSRAGTYMLRLTASDGELEGSDRMRAIVEAGSDDEYDPGEIDDTTPNDGRWYEVVASDGSKPKARHEAGGISFQNKLYLLGGRGDRPVNRYDPVTNRWENLGAAPREMNHFQPVIYQGKIYIMSALSCCYPSEEVVPRIQIYNPITELWSQGSTIPENRRRGSAGVVERNNKIYLVGGSTNGHDGGMVNWFDEYDPATDSWRTLPNAPNKRDHFGATLVGDKLVAAGGRRTYQANTFGDLVGDVDVYNFNTEQWETNAPDIPTRRAGAVVVTHGNEVIVIGGETATSKDAEKVVEAYNVNTRKWRRLPSMNGSRHSGGAAIIGETLHVVAGSGRRGGAPELTSHEKLRLQ